MANDFDFNFELDSILSEFTDEPAAEISDNSPASGASKATPIQDAPDALSEPAFTPDGDPITHFADKYRRSESEKKKTGFARRGENGKKKAAASRHILPQKEAQNTASALQSRPEADETRIMPVKKAQTDDDTRRIPEKKTAGSA